MADIGIMGGTFDPIHNGHLLLGKQAYEEYHLDEIWFMPSGTPPHKRDHHVTGLENRCQMVQLAIEDYPYFKFSDFEVRRPGNTYTAQTLQLLKEAFPEHQFYFIIGADSLYELESWYHPQEILHQTTLLVAGREYEGSVRTLEDQMEYLRNSYHATIYPLHCETVDISSGELRAMNARSKPIFKYVPANVEQYINTHQLYQENT